MSIQQISSVQREERRADVCVGHPLLATRETSLQIRLPCGSRFACVMQEASQKQQLFRGLSLWAARGEGRLHQVLFERLSRSCFEVL